LLHGRGDAGFTRRFEKAGFAVEELEVRAAQEGPAAYDLVCAEGVGWPEAD
jgi:hypothetical protein